MAPDFIHITDEQLVMMFAASCVEWAADKLQCDYLDVFNRMDRAGLIDNYIIKHYDVVHTESRENVTTDIIDTLIRWEHKHAIA